MTVTYATEAAPVVLAGPPSINTQGIVSWLLGIAIVVVVIMGLAIATKALKGNFSAAGKILDVLIIGLIVMGGAGVIVSSLNGTAGWILGG